MSVEELRFYIFAICNKHQTGNNLTPDEFNSYLARANEDLFRKEVGLREQPNGLIDFDNSQVSTDALLPFIKEGSLPGVGGLFNLPVDYRHTISATNSVNGRIITFLTKRQFDEILTDAINTPNDTYPYATFINGFLKVAPSTVTPINFTYLRKPAVPFWNYTIQNDEEVYNPVGSVQLEWPEIQHLPFLRIILGYLGIQYEDQVLIPMMEEIKKSGI